MILDTFRSLFNLFMGYFNAGWTAQWNFIFTFWLLVGWFLFWFNNGDIIGQWLLRSNFAIWIVWQHNFHLDTEHTLTQKYVTGGSVDVYIAWIT